ncbi:MAG: hypothetical protein JW753_03985 [Dehalococcoidia bacterium]|nr:hypothetical protein [Dehalococcoidia bacterium]
MEQKPERRIAVDIDTLLAVVGAFAGLELTAWLAITMTNRFYPIFAGFAFAACLGYLVLKKRAVSALRAQPVTEQRGSRSIYLLLNILFFSLMSCALIAMALRSDQYSRPGAFFVCVALASAVLAAEVVLLPSEKGHAYFTVAKIVFLVLALIWSSMVLYPSLLGMDPFYHADFTEAMLDGEHIPTGEYYSTFAGMHLTTGTTMLVADLDYKMASMLSASLMYAVVGLSFLFLLGRSISSVKVGLLAALLVGVSAFYLRWGWWMSPNAYALVFMLPSVYLLIRDKGDCPTRLMALAMLLMGILIITHTMVAACMALFLALSWVGYHVYLIVYQEKFRVPLALGVGILFSAAMLFSWMVGAAHPITTLRELIAYGFAADFWTQTLPQSADYMSTIPFWEYFLRTVTEPVFWALSFVGCLAYFSRRFGNRHGFVLAISGIVLLAIGVFSVAASVGVLSSRWQYMSVFLLGIPAGAGLLMIGGIRAHLLQKAALLAVIVGGLSFISIVSPMANMDHPITSRNTTVRYAYTESELWAATTIANTWSANVASDGYYSDVFPPPKTAGVKQSLSTDFINKDFSNRRDQVVVIRQEILEKPFYLPEIYKLDYDPRQVLKEQGFSQVYDCGTVSAYAYLVR